MHFVILIDDKDVRRRRYRAEPYDLFFDNSHKRIQLFWPYHFILALKFLGRTSWKLSVVMTNKPIEPVAKYPVRFSFLVLVGLPACRFDGALSYRGFPTFPNKSVQWYSNLSGHGRGGGCVYNIIFISHSLLACHKTRPTLNKETNFDMKSSKGF